MTALRCPKCGSTEYRVENFFGKAYCRPCGEAFNESRLTWLRQSHDALLDALKAQRCSWVPRCLDSNNLDEVCAPCRLRRIAIANATKETP